MLKETETLGIVIYDRFSLHGLANLVEPLRAANMLSGRKLYHWDFLSLEGGVVHSSSGLPVQSASRLADSKGDLLCLVPSYGFEQFATPQHLRELRAAATRYKRVAGLDTGAWLMAASGLLDGHRATIHWDELDHFAETFPDVDVTDERVVQDRDRITCGGAMTSFDLALDLIAVRHGAQLRVEVASVFMHGERRDFQDRGFRPSGNQIVDGAVAIMRRHIEVPLPMSEIAAAVQVSPRKLSRLFQVVLGAAPQSVYKSLRLAEAARLLTATRFTIAEIALRAGYDDASAMTRAFKDEFGKTPRALRQQNQST